MTCVILSLIGLERRYLMANQKNLKPFNTMSSEEAVKIQTKGRYASVEARKKKKAFKKQMEQILELPISNFFQKQDMEELGIKEEDMNNQMLLVATLFKKAIDGNVKAIDTILEMVDPIEQNINARNNDFVSEENP